MTSISLKQIALWRLDQGVWSAIERAHILLPPEAKECRGRPPERLVFQVFWSKFCFQITDLPNSKKHSIQIRPQNHWVRRVKVLCTMWLTVAELAWAPGRYPHVCASSCPWLSLYQFKQTAHRPLNLHLPVSKEAKYKHHVGFWCHMGYEVLLHPRGLVFTINHTGQRCRTAYQTVWYEE